MKVGKSVTDGEDTEYLYSVVDLEFANKEALWERDILLFFPHNQHFGVFYLEQLTNAIASESDTSYSDLPYPIDCETQVDEGDPFYKVQGSIQLTPTQIDADNDDLRVGMDHIVYSSSFARLATEHVQINSHHTRGSQ